MKDPICRFDDWMRTDFRSLNTQLEEAYFEAPGQPPPDRPDVEGWKQRLLAEGAALTQRIAEVGTLPGVPDERYELLGVVGFFLGACRRHGIDAAEPQTGALQAAEGIASRLGSSLGVAPRYVFAHQAFWNTAVDGSPRSFTSLPDERAFIDNNGLAVLAYQRAAAALKQIAPMGVSNPMAAYLLRQARAALDDVLGFDQAVSRTVAVDRFFYSVRPYFKPYRVAGREYRGANAGDFAGINEIDLVLGLCTTRDPFYQRVLVDKHAYVPPADQMLLQTAVDRPSLLDAFIAEAEAGGAGEQLRENAHLFLDICRAHGAVTTYHHHRLVMPYLERPAQAVSPEWLDDISASGPPLAVVIGHLERLRDLRTARDKPGLATERKRLDRLRHLVGDGRSEQC